MDYNSLSCFLIVFGFNLYFLKDGFRKYIEVYSFTQIPLDWIWLPTLLWFYSSCGIYNLVLFVQSIL